MKVSVLVSAVAVSLAAVAPAHAQDSAVLEQCVKSFVADRFDGQNTVVRYEIDRNYNMPLVLRRYATQQVKLVATSKGRTLATATCTSKDKDGVVIVEDVIASDLIAAR
jgi:hypothetical protein